MPLSDDEFAAISARCGRARLEGSEAEAVAFVNEDAPRLVKELREARVALAEQSKQGGRELSEALSEITLLKERLAEKEEALRRLRGELQKLATSNDYAECACRHGHECQGWKIQKARARAALKGNE